MPKYPLILSLLLVFALGCEREAGEEEQLPVIFGAPAGAEDETRAGGGVIDVGNLASMGVFASYTGQSDWSEDAAPNFMYNQLVEKSGTWTYTPLKYWPNTTGDKLTFFAYAPHTDNTNNSLLVATDNTTAGYPKLSYTVPANAANQIDLLAAVPLKDKTRGSELSFNMGHVLTHVSFKVEITGDDITLTSLSVKNCNNQGELTFNEGGYSWTSLQGTETFKGLPADVDGTKTFEFFLLPSKGSSNIELAFDDGSPKTLTSELSGPDWKMGGSVVYTLKIGGVAPSSVSKNGENAHLSVSAISTF
ncbi:MAG: fimbrillin family protein [Parabacteroides gordonii]|uniref:fimbrillin family protein n=1 Tax=Parabacteroides gordonii TaxID=574930 RepID=UPI003A8628DC